MTQRFWPVVHDRIARLTETLRQLKERVRDAVASEMGRVVADTVRDLIQTILHSRPTTSSTPQPPASRYRDEDEPEDGWDDDEDDEYKREYRETPPNIPTTSPVNTPPVSTWATALSVGAVVAKWLIRRRLPFWPTVGIGVGVGTVAMVSKPILQTTLAAASAAVDLVRMTQFPE